MSPDIAARVYQLLVEMELVLEARLQPAREEPERHEPAPPEPMPSAHAVVH